MVTEALVIETFKEPLTQEMIEAGKALTLHLQERLALAASFWFYLAESNSWRLHLASPLVATQGPRSVYRQVQAALLRMGQEQAPRPLDLEQITAVDDQDTLVTLLRIAGHGGFKKDTRLSRTAVNGQYIEDAYIYGLLPA